MVSLSAQDARLAAEKKKKKIPERRQERGEEARQHPAARRGGGGRGWWPKGGKLINLNYQLAKSLAPFLLLLGVINKLDEFYHSISQPLLHYATTACLPDFPSSVASSVSVKGK